MFPGHSGDSHNPHHGQPCSHFTDEKAEAQRSELAGWWQGWVQTKVCPIPKLRFPPLLHDTGSPQRHKGLISEGTLFLLLSQPASWVLCSLMRGPPLPQEPTCMTAGLVVLELLPPLRPRVPREQPCSESWRACQGHGGSGLAEEQLSSPHAQPGWPPAGCAIWL